MTETKDKFDENGAIILDMKDKAVQERLAEALERVEQETTVSRPTEAEMRALFENLPEMPGGGNEDK
jgi:hypothetical protein